MSLKHLAIAAFVAALPATANAHMEIEDAYVRSSSAMAQSAAIFMTIRNHSDDDDRLFRATTDAANRVELHTHSEDENGVMRMMEIEGGIMLPSGETHALARGGDHIMLMGLTEPLEQGDTIEVILFFDEWLPMTITVPVDNERQPTHGETMDNGEMDMTHDADDS